MIDRLSLDGRLPGQIVTALRGSMPSASPIMVFERTSLTDRSDGGVRHRRSRWFIIAAWPVRTFELRGDALTIMERSDGLRTACSVRSCRPGTDDPLAPLHEELLRRKRSHTLTSGANTDAALLARLGLPWSGGLAGFIGYDCARYFERLPEATGSHDAPDMFFMSTGTLLIGDRERNELYVVTFAEAGERSHRERVSIVREVLSHPPPRLSEQDSAPPCGHFTEEEFVRLVEQAKDYIRAGDIYQVVLSNRLTVLNSVDPYAVYDTLLERNPSPYHFLCEFPGGTYVGASPEVMLRGMESEAGTTVRMRLVAGTYPTGVSPLSSRTLAEDLADDDKERAEHLMLVDHARNDIGRVSAGGSVTVHDLFNVETYADLHHLVSQVSGTLAPGESVLSALRSCFPIATLTGTPKIRAMQIIQELEAHPRGIFGGALALVGDDGSIDSTVAIRAATCLTERTIVDAGAGIVFDSSPPREHQECRLKARAVLRALRASYTDPQPVQRRAAR